MKYSKVVILACLLLVFTVDAKIDSWKFMIKRGFKLTPAVSSESETHTVTSLSRCTQMCVDSDMCLSSSFTLPSTCVLMDAGIYTSGATLSVDADSVVMARTEQWTDSSSSKKTYNKWEGHKMTGGSLVDVTHRAINKLFCMQLCDNTASCRSASWSESAKNCILSESYYLELASGHSFTSDAQYDIYHQDGCPTGLSYAFENSCFGYRTTQAFPEDQKTYCENLPSHGSRLAEPTVARLTFFATLDVAYGLLSPQWYGGASGYYDQYYTTKFDPAMWSTNEPNGNANEPHVEFIRSAGKLNDITRVNNRYGAICEAIKMRSCPDGWVNKYEDFESCYYITDSVSQYQAAKTTCQNLHSLAGPPTVQSAEENQFLYDKMIETGNNMVWLSLTGNPNRYEFENDGYWVYDGWHTGEPNNPTGEQCAVLRSSDNKWNDVPCTVEAWVVCEISMRKLSGEERKYSVDNLM